MLELLNEITQTQADLIKSFAMFYLLLVGSHVDTGIFTCFQLKYINNNKWLKIFLAFLLLYFLVSVVSKTGNLEFTPPIEKLAYSFVYFFVFLIVMRLDLRLTAIVLFLVFVIYFIELNKDFYLHMYAKINNQADKDIYNSKHYWITFDWPFKIRLCPVKLTDFNIINTIETIVYYTIIMLLVVGFISYGGELHDTVKMSKHLTWFDVLFDTNMCSLNERKSFWHYLKIGVGLKL